MSKRPRVRPYNDSSLRARAESKFPKFRAYAATLSMNPLMLTVGVGAWATAPGVSTASKARAASAPPTKTRFMTISSCVDDGVCVCHGPGHEGEPTHSPMGNVVAHDTFRRKRGNLFWELCPRVGVLSHGTRAHEWKDSRHREAGRLARPLCLLERARRDQGDWILSNR